MSAKGQIAIVTGGHKGIGKEIARGLLSKRAKVYIASRNMEKCKETRDEIMLENSDAIIEYFPCDMGDFDSIKKFVRKFKREEKKLHILINNCDVMWGPRRVTKNGIEMQLGINYVGHFYLTNLLIDHLMAVDNRVKTCLSNKIIILTNVAHIIGAINFDDLNSERSYSATRAYAQSQLAKILWARELAQKLDGTGIVVNAVNPGVYAPALTQKTGWHGYKTAAEAAVVPLRLALNPEYAYVNGQLFGDHLNDLTDIQMHKCADMKVATRLWDATEKLVETHSDYNAIDGMSPSANSEGSKQDDKSFDYEVLKDPQALVGWISSQSQNVGAVVKSDNLKLNNLEI